MTAQTKLSAKGQVVIPKDVRDRLGFTEGTVFDVIERGSEIVLKRQRKSSDPSGPEMVANAVKEIQSFFRYDGPPVSLADMDQAVLQAVSKKVGGKSAR